MTIFDVIPSLAVPFATLMLAFGAMTLNAVINGGVVIDTVDAHKALLEIARREVRS